MEFYPRVDSARYIWTDGTEVAANRVLGFSSTNKDYLHVLWSFAINSIIAYTNLRLSSILNLLKDTKVFQYFTSAVSTCSEAMLYEIQYGG